MECSGFSISVRGLVGFGKGGGWYIQVFAGPISFEIGFDFKNKCFRPEFAYINSLECSADKKRGAVEIMGRGVSINFLLILSEIVDVLWICPLISFQCWSHSQKSLVICVIIMFIHSWVVLGICSVTKSSFKNSMCDWLFSWNIMFCIDKFLYGPLLEQVPLKECSTAKRKFSPKTLI